LQQDQEQIQKDQQDLRMRYSAEVPILKGDGSVVMERCDFAPRIKGDDGDGDGDGDDDGEKGRVQSRILAVQAPLPLGILLGQSEEMPGLTLVDEVVPGSNGAEAGVKEGDLLRACTACQVTMDMPTWQLMAGGIGQPKTSRMMFSTDGKVFEEVMDALISNRMDPQGRDVWLVLERVDDE